MRCGRNQPHHSFPKWEARREGDFMSPARSNHSPCEFSLFIADSHLPVALTAPSARGCTVCHVGLSRSALDGRRHFSCKVQTIASYERVLFVSSPHRIVSHHQPPTSNTGPAPEPEPDYRRDCPRSKPRVGEASPPFGSFCHPLGEAFLALWGWGNPLVRFPPSPPTPFEARTGRRRCKPPASPHFGGFAVIKHNGGLVPSPIYSWMPSRRRDNPSSPLIQGTLQADISDCGTGDCREGRQYRSRS